MHKRNSKRPPCVCDKSPHVRCDDEHCGIAAPMQHGVHGGCVLCWQFFHSEIHRKLWGGEGPPKPVPKVEIAAPQVLTAPKPLVVTTTLSPPAIVAGASAPVLSASGVPKQPPAAAVPLGDLVKAALDAAGVTQEFAAKWLGCTGCQARQQKLNRLSAWAEQALKGSKENALRLFRKLTGT